MTASWKDLQPGSAWGRKLTPEMYLGTTIQIACRLKKEKTAKIREVTFDKDYCFEALDKFFSNFTKEEIIELIDSWVGNENKDGK